MRKRNLDELRIGDGSAPAGSPELDDAGVVRTIRASARWRTIALRAAAPVLAWFALGIVLFGAQNDTDYDLQLIAADSGAPGELLPIRARLYENLRGLEGPRLSARPIDLRLTDHHGRIHARTRLLPARGGHSDMEGSLRLPAAVSGAFRLHASVQIDRTDVEVQRRLRVGAPARLVPEGRPLRALQQFSEGPLSPAAGAVAPDRMRVRVGGGVCVPEEECHVFVHVGVPGAAVWIEGNSTVTPGAGAAQPSAETDGVVLLSIVTHGPEAQLWLRASRGGREVAQRSVRLPIALGASQLRLREPLLPAPGLPDLALLGGEGGCIVDVFRDGQWVRTGSQPSCAELRKPPFPPLTAGVYRVQARHDPFGAAMSGVALAYVLAPNEHRSAALRELARRVVAVDSSDRFARAALAAADAELQLDAAGFGYLAAALETGVIALPHAVSGYAATLERLAHTQSRLRWMSIAALVLGALSLALAVGRSGFLAAARADAILLDAGQAGPVRRRARARAMFSLALSVLSLLLVFAVLGAYVVARSSP